MSSLRRMPSIPKFRTRTVKEKTAVMGPGTYAKLREKYLDRDDLQVQSNQFTGGPAVEHFQGMPVQVRDDVPDDKVYILEGRTHEVPVYDEPKVKMAMMDEFRESVPEPSPLQLLHARVERVCRRAR